MSLKEEYYDKVNSFEIIYDKYKKDICKKQKDLFYEYYPIKYKHLKEKYKKEKIYHILLFERYLELAEYNLKNIKKEIKNCQTGMDGLGTKFGIWGESYLSFLYVDFYCWFILQIVNNDIFMNLEMKNRKDCINRLKDKIDNAIISFEKAHISKIEIKENRVFYYYALFFLFLLRRNKLLYRIKMLKYLKVKRGDLKERDEKYKYDKNKDYSDDKVHISYYLENDKIDNKTKKHT